MAERIPVAAGTVAERERVCRQLHFLGLLLRGRRMFDPAGVDLPEGLIALSQLAAQPDHPSRRASGKWKSTEEFARVLEELEAWCHAHGLEYAVRAAADRPALIPIRLDGHG